MRLHKDWYIFILCILLSSIFLLPQILLREPNFLDVSETWAFGTSVIQAVRAEFVSLDRFRPLFVFERSTLNRVFLYYQPYYFAFFALLLSLTLFFVYIVSQKKVMSYWLYIISSIFLLVSPITIDTYWRLGVTENVFALVLLVCIFFLFRARYLFFTVFLFLFIGSKETALFYIPVFLVVLVLRRRFMEAVLASVVYILFAMRIYSLARYASVHPFVYTAIFSASLSSLVDMMQYYIQTYIFYGALVGISLCLFVYRIRKHHRRFWYARYASEFIFISFIIIGFVALLFFPNRNQPYYMFPLMVTIMTYLTWELARTTFALRIFSVLYCMLIFFLAGIPAQTFSRMLYWHNDYVGDGVLVAEIRRTVNRHKYSFDQAYRPELTPALDILYDMYPSSSDHKEQYIVYKYRHGVVMPWGGRLLCGKTFFNTSYCKWIVLPRKAQDINNI